MRTFLAAALPDATARGLAAGMACFTLFGIGIFAAALARQLGAL